MSLGLQLLPVFHDNSFAHNLLVCDGDDGLFIEIKALDASRFAAPINSHLGNGKNGYCYGVTKTTAYGEPLRWVWASDLASLSKHSGVRVSQANRAIWAYLRALPRRTRIGLYWC